MMMASIAVGKKRRYAPGFESEAVQTQNEIYLYVYGFFVHGRAGSGTRWPSQERAEKKLVISFGAAHDEFVLV